jgi:hypothetical protein
VWRWRNTSGLSQRVRYCEYGELDLSISSEKGEHWRNRHDVTAEFASQFGGRGEDAPPDHLGFDFGEPEFDLVESRRIGRSEVKVHPRILLQGTHAPRWSYGPTDCPR